MIDERFFPTELHLMQQMSEPDLEQYVFSLETLNLLLSDQRDTETTPPDPVRLSQWLTELEQRLDTISRAVRIVTQLVEKYE